mmetsp:Transcript_72682/g.189575  ORF Transcript_72682/g.189575 Transcript_72682/m.189575 type:complete len:315 (-) Transcript_72682:91-1035(-)
MTLHPGEVTQAQSDRILHQQHFADARQELNREKHEVAKLVAEEFQRPVDPNTPLQHELQMHQGGEEVVYGGMVSAEPQELQLVRAWRPTPLGEWEIGTGVVHRVHKENQTITVQFLPDQHRCRLPFASVKPILDITPTYPKVRLMPGERLPTRTELLAREQEAHARRQALGIPPEQPLPGDEDPNSLRAGETLNEHGHPVVKEDRWGIPGPTLDALRNYSIPGLQVGSEYGSHFYSKLYSNNFYSQAPQMVTSTGHVGVDERKHMAQHILSHRYIPLEGPELEQDLRTGSWHAVEPDGAAEPPESRGWLAYLFE